MLCMIGIAVAQPSLLAIWYSFSSDSLARRGLLYGLGVVAAVSAWLIGFSFYGLETTQSISRQLLENGIWVNCFLPIFLLTLLLPLLLTRQIFGTCFQNVHQVPTNARRQFTIKQIMLATFFAAAVLACSQIPLAMGFISAQESAGIPAMIGGFGFGLGLFVLLPLVSATMRSKGFWFWSPLFVVGGTAVYFGFRALYTFRERGRIPSRVFRNISFESTVIVFALLTIVCFLFGLRRLGYRICRKPINSADD